MRAENAPGEYLETVRASDAYQRGVDRARAVMAGEDEPIPVAVQETPVVGEPVRCVLETRRRVRKIAETPAVWIESRHVEGDTPTEVIAQAVTNKARRVHLVGPRPRAGDNAGFHAWAHAPVEGWTVDRHYVERPETPVLRWVDADGRKVEAQRATTWFGADADTATAEDCATAWHHVAELVERAFPGATLLATPATTGRELFSRIIGADQRWPVLPDDVAQLIRTTSGQGRIELVDGPDTIGGFYELDGRFMYGALCKEVPCGEPERWNGEHPYGPYARCRVRASWTVPATWEHVGILPMASEAGGWRYPRRPGEHGTGWLDGAELSLARAQGWAITVHESLVWPTKGDPLGAWAQRLGRARAGALNLPASGTVIGLVRAALRKTVIDAIGAFVGRPHVVTKSVPLESADLPAGAISPHIEGDHLVWGEAAGAAWPEMSHPEWSAAVWARCRVRMLDGPDGHGGRTGALHVNPADVLAFRTDALYLATNPGWPDDRKDGRLRLKAGQAGERRRPRTSPDLFAMRSAVRHG